MTVLGLLSLLLRYPDEDVLAARAQIAEAVSALAPGPPRDAVERFLGWFRPAGANEVQTAYVDTFDFGRRTSLHLTYPTHGDRRERGMALLAIKARYAVAGMELDGAELPDHLAVMLEFADASPGGLRLLAEHHPALELLRSALHADASPFAHLLDAVSACLPQLTAAERAQVEQLAAGGPPTEEVGLEPFAPPEHVTGAGLRR